MTTNKYPPFYDAIVVGARCAGAATAMLLARGGMRVLMVDAGTRGRDTCSTHALMKGGVIQLSKWGLLEQVDRAGTPPILKTTFHYRDEIVDVELKPKDGIHGLRAPRRTVLDPILVDAAEQAGVEARYGLRLVDLLKENQRVRGVVLRDTSGTEHCVSAPLVIGADGRRSLVAQKAGALAYRTSRSMTSTIYAYWAGLELDGYHWHYDLGVAAGAIPTSHGLTCVFVGMKPERFAQGRRDIEGLYASTLAQAAPGLFERLAVGNRVRNFWRFEGAPGHLRQCFGPGWALVGDAGYFKDPLTSHGITDALRDAELLANAALDGDPRAFHSYQERRDALSGELFDTTEAIAAMNWSLEELQTLHIRLSRAMKVEAEALARPAEREMRAA